MRLNMVAMIGLAFSFLIAMVSAATYTLETLAAPSSSFRPGSPNRFITSYRPRPATPAEPISSSTALPYQASPLHPRAAQDLHLIWYCESETFNGSCWESKVQDNVCRTLHKTINSFRAPIDHYCFLYNSKDCREETKFGTFIRNGHANGTLAGAVGYPFSSYVCMNEAIDGRPG